MRRSLIPTTILVIIAVLVGATFASAALAQENGQKRVVWSIGKDDDVDSMNQFIMVSEGYTIHAMSYDLLTGLSTKDLSPIPALATEVPTQENGGVSPDGLTWTFNIRTGVKWSDGEPLTAHDIEYTYNRVIDEHQGCCFSYLKLVDTVTAPDDTTLVITTTKPTSLMSFIYIFIYPEHVWSNVSTEDAKTFENFPAVTSGPFHPVDWKKGQFMRLEANPDYYGGAPHVDEIVYRVFNNQDAAVAALKAGEIDFIDNLSANLFDSLANQPGIGTHEAVQSAFWHLYMNVGAPQGDGNPVLRDEQFRRAIAMAIDKQELVDKVLLGHGTTADTIVPPFSGIYHLDVPEDQKIPFDIPGANQLLDEAGYADTDGNGIRNAKGGGEDIVLRYFVTSSNEEQINAAPFVQAWLKQIGIDSELTALSTNKATDVIVQGEYDIMGWDWFPDPDPDFILSVLTCAQRPILNAQGQNVGGIWSDSYYCNDQYDQWYAEQKTAVSIKDRADIIKQMQLQVYEAAPYVIFWYPSDLQAYSSKWTGFHPQPDPNGDLLSQYANKETWVGLQLKAGETAGGGSKGIPAAVWIGIVVAALVVIAAIVLTRRRGVSDEDRA